MSWMRLDLHSWGRGQRPGHSRGEVENKGSCSQEATRTRPEWKEEGEGTWKDTVMGSARILVIFLRPLMVLALEVHRAPRREKRANKGGSFAEPWRRTGKRLGLLHGQNSPPVGATSRGGRRAEGLEMTSSHLLRTSV